MRSSIISIYYYSRERTLWTILIWFNAHLFVWLQVCHGGRTMLLLHPIKNDDYCIKTQEPKKGIYICTSFKGPKSLMQNLLIIQFCYGAKSYLTQELCKNDKFWKKGTQICWVPTTPNQEGVAAFPQKK